MAEAINKFDAIGQSLTNLSNTLKQAEFNSHMWGWGWHPMTFCTPICPPPIMPTIFSVDCGCSSVPMVVSGGCNYFPVINDSSLQSAYSMPSLTNYQPIQNGTWVDNMSPITTSSYQDYMNLNNSLNNILNYINSPNQSSNISFSGQLQPGQTYVVDSNGQLQLIQTQQQVSQTQTETKTTPASAVQTPTAPVSLQSMPLTPQSVSLDSVDRLLYPERYNNPSGATQQDKNRPVVETRDNISGRINTPTWYTSIITKLQKNEQLTENERTLKNSYEKIMQDNSPYQIDEYGNYKYDNDGNVMPSDFYHQIITLRSLMAAKDRNGMEALLTGLSDDQLAALEAHFVSTSPDPSDRKTLREAIKECSLVSGLGWTGWNTDRCQRIFDRLDNVSAATPINTAQAIYQALNNHHIGGLGCNSEKVIELLSKVQGNKAFLSAVEEEYQKLTGQPLRTDISFKWSISSADKLQLSNILNGISGQ